MDSDSPHNWLILEKQDTNMVSARVLRAGDESVLEGEFVVELETDKAVLELTAPQAGSVRYLCDIGVDYPVGYILAVIDERPGEIDGVRERNRALLDMMQGSTIARGPTVSGSQVVAPKKVKATPAARRVAKERCVHVEHVERYWRHKVPPKGRRIALLGAGLGATQVIDILAHCSDSFATAILDDDEGKIGGDVMDVPILGTCERLKHLYEGGAADSAVITISTSIGARVKLAEMCTEIGIPLATVVHPTCYIGAEADVGMGNVFCAFCHVGAFTKIGDNNFFSAYNSFDHHNVIGSDCSTGPACATSGIVTIGDRVRLGTGITVEPHLTIGDDALVASGLTVTRDIPEEHVAKARKTNMHVVRRK